MVGVVPGIEETEPDHLREQLLAIRIGFVHFEETDFRRDDAFGHQSPVIGVLKARRRLQQFVVGRGDQARGLRHVLRRHRHDLRQRAGRREVEIRGEMRVLELARQRAVDPSGSVRNTHGSDPPCRMDYRKNLPVAGSS